LSSEKSYSDGYKNHVNVDAKHKFIRRFEVTSASVHDSQAVKSLLDKKNSGKEVYADSAYVGEEIDNLLEANNLQSRINEKGYRNRPSGDEKQEGIPKIIGQRLLLPNIFQQKRPLKNTAKLFVDS